MRFALWIALALPLAISAQPSQPDPLMLERNRALQLADQGHEAEALDMILGIIRRAPLFQPAYAQLDLLANRAGKQKEALATLRALVQSGPEYAGAWLGVALLSPDPASQLEAYFRCAHGAPEAWMCFYYPVWHFKQSLHGRLAISDLQRRLGHPLTAPNDHLLLARYYEVSGHIRQAVEELGRAQAGADLPRKAQLEMLLGECSAGSPDTWAEAGVHYRRAAEIASDAQDWPMMIGSLVDGAIAVKGARAIAMFQEALKLARAHELPSSEADALYYLSKHDLDEAKLADALNAAERGVELCERLHMRGYRTEFLLRCASVHRLEGDDKRAVAALEEARRCALPVDWDRADIFRGLGVEYENLGDYLKSLQCQFEAVRAYESANRHDAAGAQLGNIGELYKSLGDYSDALFYDRQSLEMARRFHDPPEKMRNLINLADVHAQMKQPLQAARLLRDALALDAEARDPAWKAAALMLRGEIYRSGRQPQLAIAPVEEASTSSAGGPMPKAQPMPWAHSAGVTSPPEISAVQRSCSRRP